MSEMFGSLEGRSVVVTGGTRGIGKGIASVFARAGAKVLITGRDGEIAQRAVDELSVHGTEVSYVLADIGTRSGADSIAETAVSRHGGIDILCANAGIFPETNLVGITEADLDLVYGTNVKGTILVVSACVPALTVSGRGRVIITSSITGPITGYPGWSHYGASKAAQLGFMRTAAVELAPHKITVNAVLPGNILTEGLADMGPEYIKSMEDAIPFGALGTVEDIGYAALFFATDEAGYITGQAMAIDGGQVLPESPDAIIR